VVHHFLFAFVTPIDIADALMTIVKICNMSCPIFTQHALHTMAHIANCEFFLNPLVTLLFLTRTLVEVLLMIIVAWISWLI
jgi:hypothetical protein